MRLSIPALAAAVAVIVLVALFAALKSSPGQGRATLSASNDASLPADLKPVVQRLAAADPAERARGLLELQAMAPLTPATVPYLLALLPDRTPVRVERDRRGSEVGSSDQGGIGYFTCPGALAARVLAGSGEPGILALLTSIAHRSETIRRSALEGAGYAVDPRIAPQVVRALSDESPLVREAARMALQRLGPRAIDALDAALRDRDARIRTGAAEVLSHLPDHRASRALLASMNDGRDAVRAAAAHGLGRLRDPAWVPPMIASLDDPALRKHAANALARLSSPYKSELLIAALRDPDFRLRAGAAFALSIIKDPNAAEALRQAQQDPHDEVRQQAAQALAALTAAADAVK